MIETIIEKLAIPEACKLDKPVFKKLFLENTDLNVTDKKALKDDVSKIRWLYTLKPATINITAFADETCEYTEVAVLTIGLSNEVRVKRIAEFIHKAIPYPLILIFSYRDKFCIGVADKRINQADKSKWVVEDSALTEWIDAHAPTRPQADFMEDCAIQYLAFSNFLAFYGSFRDRVIAVNTANRTGTYRLETPERSAHRLDRLQAIERIERELVELRARLKKEKQMARKIDLNTKIKQCKDDMIKLVEAL